MKYKDHNEAMREAERRFDDRLRDADQKFDEERDKRYASENELRAIALRIKESADAKALDLASQIQNYKDDRTEKTREQSLSERGAYVTQSDLKQVIERSDENLASVFKEIKLSLKPMIDHIAADTGSQLTIGRMIGYIVAVGVVMGIVFSLINLVL